MDRVISVLFMTMNLLELSMCFVFLKLATFMTAMTKMTGGTPEVRSDKSLTLLTFGPMDQWTNGPVFSLISKQKVLRARKGKPEHQKSSCLS